jgi:hypothetical protein
MLTIYRLPYIQITIDDYITFADVLASCFTQGASQCVRIPLIQPNAPLSGVHCAESGSGRVFSFGLRESDQAPDHSSFDSNPVRLSLWVVTSRQSSWFTSENQPHERRRIDSTQGQELPSASAPGGDRVIDRTLGRN